MCFLGPTGAEQSTPVIANVISLADPPAWETKAADVTAKQSM